MKDKSIVHKDLKVNEKYFLIDNDEPISEMVKEIEITHIMPTFGTVRFFYSYVDEIVVPGFSKEKHVIREHDKVYQNKNDALGGIIQILKDQIKEYQKEIKK